MKQKIGRILAPSDLNMVLTGAARVFKPNGELLCIYVPGAIPSEMGEQVWPILSSIKEKKVNRGMASGAGRVRAGTKTSYAKPVASNIIGFIEEAPPRYPACRTTAWTGQHAEQFRSLYPYFQQIGETFQTLVPDRYKVQKSRAEATRPEWVIEGTPFSTVTVNNTYSTGVHQDAGDLREGFSCLSVLRRGSYTGGILTFPEFRIGVDLQDRDVILMDAHEWHGNTAMVPNGYHERVSVVLYYRTDIVSCGSFQDEFTKAKQRALVSKA